MSSIIFCPTLSLDGELDLARAHEVKTLPGLARPEESLAFAQPDEVYDLRQRAAVFAAEQLEELDAFERSGVNCSFKVSCGGRRAARLVRLRGGAALRGWPGLAV